RLLDRHLAGEASPDDQVALRRWLAADPTREGVLRALSSTVRSSGDADWDTGRAWSRVSARLHEPRFSLHLDRPPVDHSRGRVWLVAGAVAAAAGALIAFVWWPLDSGHSRVGAPAVSAIAAAAAQQTSVTLRD